MKNLLLIIACFISTTVYPVVEPIDIRPNIKQRFYNGSGEQISPTQYTALIEMLKIFDAKAPEKKLKRRKRGAKKKTSNINDITEPIKPTPKRFEQFDPATPLSEAITPSSTEFLRERCSAFSTFVKN